MEIVSIITGPATEAGKWLFGVLKRQISYISNYSENLENLRSQASDLQMKGNDILKMLEEAGERLEEPYEEVLAWVKKLQQVQVVVAEINQEAMANQRCLKGLCPDIALRRHLSKRAIKTLVEVISLQQKGSFPKVSRNRRPPDVELVQVDWVEGFMSRDVIMKEVMEALLDDSIRTIGVYGMGGSGKTTLMKSLNNRLLGRKHFSKVIMVTVSQKLDLIKIQDDISSRLGLNLEPDDSVLTRANKLFDRLNKEKVLLILDDVWEEIDVLKIGVPCDGGNKGAKLIITTRIYDVCIQMKIGSRVEMKLLSEVESWDLFEAKAGNVVSLPALKPIAAEIVTRCKGSPLAIVVLGSSLREVDDIRRWRRALKVLKSPNAGGVQGVMHEVAASLRYSYNHLVGHEIKLCFLFCCLFPDDYNISLSELRNYGIAEGFLNAHGGSLEDALDELIDHIAKLRNCCLLLNGDEEGCIKMHDLVRDVAIWIASEDENGFLVNIGGQLGNWSEVDKIKVYKRISFMNFENVLIFSIPSECQQLQLRSLLIRGNESITVDQGSFFDKMKALVVLDIRCKQRQTYRARNIAYSFSVPESIVHLKNLKALFLVECDISSNVHALGGMTNLEILCLRASRICILPEEIGNLIKLKCLDLTNAELSEVAPTVISRLSNLEELLAWNGFKDWDLEMASLVRLVRLEAQLQSEKFNVSLFPWKHIKNFRLAIDFDSPGRKQIKFDNILYLGSTNPLTHWINEPLSKLTQMLFLDSCYGFDGIFDLYEKGGFKNLRFLGIDSWDGIEYIINTEEEEKHALGNAFKDLEDLDICSYKLSTYPSLFGSRELPVPTTAILSGVRKITLSSLQHLKSICMGTVPTGSFQSLQIIFMNDCHGVEYLLSASVAAELQNLEYISIGGCSRMEKLVLSKREEARISSSRQTNIANSTLTTFQNLTSLNILGCERLKKIFSFSLALGLRQLSVILIHYCDQLECIIGKEDEDDGEEATYHSQGLLPKLEHLELLELPSLTSIYQGNLPLNCPNLTTINLERCPNLKPLSKMR